MALLCIVAMGYDASLMTSIIAMKPFQDTFHSKTTGNTVAIMFSMYTVSVLIAAMGSEVTDVIQGTGDLAAHRCRHLRQVR